MTVSTFNVVTDVPATFAAYPWVQTDRVDPGDEVAEANLPEEAGALWFNNVNKALQQINSAMVAGFGFQAFEFTQLSANPGSTPSNTLWQEDGTTYDAGTLIWENKFRVLGNTLSLGNEANSPLLTFAKDGSGSSTVHFSRFFATSGGNDKRIVHTTAENLEIDHYNGASWDTLMQFSTVVSVTPTLLLGGAVAGDAVDSSQQVIGDGSANAYTTYFVDATTGLGGIHVTDTTGNVQRGSLIYNENSNRWLVYNAGSARWYIDSNQIIPTVTGKTFGSQALPLAKIFMDAIRLGVEEVADGATPTIGAESWLQIDAGGTGVTATLPAAEEGLTLFIDLVDGMGGLLLTPAGDDSISHGTFTSNGLYIVYAVDDTNWVSFGPITRAS